MPFKPVVCNIIDSSVVKRDSLYQRLSKIRTKKLSDGRKNMEPYLSEDTFLSFKLIDSTPWGTSESFRFPQLEKEGLVPLQVKSKTPYAKNTNNAELLSTSNLEFLELSFRGLLEAHSKMTTSYSNLSSAVSSFDSMLEKHFQTENNCILGKGAPDFVENVQLEEAKCSRNQLFSAGIGANIINETDAACIQQSLSAMIEISNSYVEREIVKIGRDVLKSSLNSHVNPFKKLLDPFIKLKSLYNSSLIESRTRSRMPSDFTSLSQPKCFSRFFLNKFSKMSQKKFDIERDPSRSDQVMKASASPAYLHAVLKWEFNHGDPFSEFSVKDAEDVLVAKIWKTDNPFKCVYTFHCCKMKCIMVGHGKMDRCHQQSLMIGQMRVSCNLCSEISEAEMFDNSTLTEFTLYDVAKTRSIAIGRPQCLSDANNVSVLAVTECLSESKSLMVTEKLSPHFTRYFSEIDSEPSTSYPWESTELRPNLEIASIITKVSFSNKESWSNMQAQANKCFGNQDLSSSYSENQARSVSHPSPSYVKVVTPSGIHGVPNNEDVWPSSLVDRSRVGGGCDCGGWDVGCPILVFDNANYNLASISGTQQPMVLFVKGKKESIPAFTISDNGEGQYSVDFHAQLSALQAFSICIALLHSSKAFPAINQEKSKPKLYSHSIKLIFEEDVGHNTISEEEKKYKK